MIETNGTTEGCANLLHYLRQKSYLDHWPIPSLYANSDLQNPPPKLRTAEVEKNCRTLRGYATHHLSPQDKKLIGSSVVIQGEHGNGKTFLAAALANSLLEARYSVAFVDAVELLRDIKATFDQPQIEEGESWFMERLEFVDFLIIDDLGKQMQTGWSDETFWLLIKKRHDEQRPMLITTNLDESERMRDDRWSGIEDRLADDGILITLHGSSVRKRMGRASILEMEAQ